MKKLDERQLQIRGQIYFHGLLVALVINDLKRLAA